MSGVEGFDPLAYDLPVKCCGETFHVRRTLDLLRRVEQAFGPVYQLSFKLRTSAITTEELASLLYTLLKDERDAPKPTQIREWLFAAGVPHVAAALAPEVLTLIAGNDAVASHARRKAEPREGGEEPGPFSRAAG